MSYGSGLSAQIGFGVETSPGVGVTVTRFYEFLDESLTWEPTWLESAGLKAGQAYKRAARAVQSRFTVSGQVTLEHADRSMGLLWQHALGSQTTTGVEIGTTGAYRQVHIPGEKTELGLTCQVGRPQTDATVQPFTYRGLKVVEWEFSVSDGEIAQLALTFDGRDESTETELAVASYDADTGLFTFADASVFTIGGVVTTTSGLTVVSGGQAVQTRIRGITLTGATPMATERYGLGSGGEKANQIENDIPTITGTLEGEFTDRSEFYDLFKSNDTTALQLDLAHGTAGAGQPYRLSIILPAVKIKKAGANVGGPDIIGQQIEFEAYDDGSNPPIQVALVTNTSLI